MTVYFVLPTFFKTFVILLLISNNEKKYIKTDLKYIN